MNLYDPRPPDDPDLRVEWGCLAFFLALLLSTLAVYLL